MKLQMIKRSGGGNKIYWRKKWVHEIGVRMKKQTKRCKNRITDRQIRNTDTPYKTERKTDAEKTRRQTKAQEVWERQRSWLTENRDTGTEIEVEGILKQ